MNNTPPILFTPWGKAKIVDGYYRIISRKEKQGGKRLHRLIFEKFYGSIPEGYVIHHKNGNKLDNCILNLQMLRNEDHSALHSGGESHPLYGTKHSEGTKLKVANTLSKSRTSSGIFRVYKKKDLTCKNNFVWAYRYPNSEGKRCIITSVNLEKLKEKVISKGLPWIEFNELEGNKDG